MHTDSIYEYYGRQKNDMEASVIPFVVFQYIDNALHIVLISDGMCRLFDEERTEIVRIMTNTIYTTIHPEDVERLSGKWTRFVQEGGRYDVVFKRLINNSFRSIHAEGSHLYAVVQ